MNPFCSQRIRSLSVGLASAALDACLFALCTLFWAGGTALLVARWCCGAAGAVGNFTLNRIWAFRAEGRSRIRTQLGRFALAALAAVSLATAVWWVLVHSTGWDPRVLHPVSLAIVWAGFTFPVLRNWVFRGPKPSGAYHC